MPVYELKPTTNALRIAEQQYATAKKKIQFTTFTSCIGAITKKGEELTGVHLVIKGAPDLRGQEATFGANDVPKVLALLKLPADAAVVFGCFDVWRHPENGVVAAFEKLTNALSEKVGKKKGLKMYQQYEKDIGDYVAEIAGEGIIVRDQYNAQLAPVV